MESNLKTPTLEYQWGIQRIQPQFYEEGGEINLLIDMLQKIHVVVKDTDCLQKAESEEAKIYEYMLHLRAGLTNAPWKI